MTIFTEDNSFGGTSAEVIVTSELTDYPSIVGSSVKIAVTFEKEPVVVEAVLPKIYMNPDFVDPLETRKSISLSESIDKQSISLGRLVDPE